MSRAFVREDDLEDRSVAAGPERGLPPAPIRVTSGGRARLLARLDALKAALAALPDDDEPATQAHRLPLDKERRWIETVLQQAEVVEPGGQPPDQVGFGARVTVEDEQGRRRRFRLVGEVEAEPAAGSISWRSPLGRALMGAALGDVVAWSRPAGESELTVVAIDWPQD